MVKVYANKNNTSHFLKQISKKLDSNIKKIENVILIGDFNANQKDHSLITFCETYNLQNMVNEPTCYKNPDNPSSIDVILTNRRISFHSTTAIETGLSDHHKLIITVLNGKFIKKIWM